MIGAASDNRPHTMITVVPLRSLGQIGVLHNTRQNTRCNVNAIGNANANASIAPRSVI